MLKAGRKIMEKNTFRLVKNILIISAVMILAENFAVFAAQVFEPWADEVFVAIGREHGPAAEQRFRRIMEVILANQDKPVMEKVKLTNNFLNNIPWIGDPDHWKSEDYWATPFETLATFGGDCEDIAIAKYAMLRMMGIPDEALGFAYVVTQKKERHMVLVFKKNDTSPLYVLDNQVPELLTGPERHDLTAIYIFQNDGKIYLIGDDGKKRYVKNEFKGKKFEKWTSAKERALENRKKYEQYNNNKPLFPGD
jgi:predicted transglutaminase-like cysteine proteinase